MQNDARSLCSAHHNCSYFVWDAKAGHASFCSGEHDKSLLGECAGVPDTTRTVQVLNGKGLKGASILL